jgi:UDP-N-acetylmuramoylalanine--D-glutamate ligase
VAEVIVPWSAGEWRRVLVYGLGLSGRAAARLLLDRGVAVVGVDARPAAELELGELAGRPGFELAPGGEAAELPAGLDGVVVSPGVPPERPLLSAARRRGLPVIAEVELAFPLLAGTVVGITGSNGKSTTTALTGAMLRAAGRAVEVCGNIGEPLAGRVEGPPGRIFVVELSSFQLEAIATFHPRAAALLNLAPDHLDRYGDLAAYGAAKAAIFRNQEAADVAVVNAEDPLVAAAATRARRRTFSRRGPVPDGCYLAADRVVEVAPGEPPRELFCAADLPLAGVHNLENAMAAALLARALGGEPAALRAALGGFTALPHRLQRVAEIAGVAFYDDSKGTNPAATAKSLEGFADASVHLILGGRNKGADFAELAPVVSRKARRLYLIGEAAGEIAAALGPLAPAERAGTLEAAVAAAAAAALPGEAVVLSPACASFDQFRNFAHRGEEFQRLVRGLPAAPGQRGGAGGQEAGL